MQSIVQYVIPDLAIAYMRMDERLKMHTQSVSDNMAGGFSGAKSKGFSRLSLTARSFATYVAPKPKKKYQSPV